MNNIIIRDFTPNDIPAIVDIWYEVSLDAHKFIAKEYWANNRDIMEKKYIPQSETYIAIHNEQIVGFVSLIDNYLAAIFVRIEYQGKGIGSDLLNHVKAIKKQLSLKVYSKNTKSKAFYQSKGFNIIEETVDPDTEENEVLMLWKR
ncbi:N-acetyltransferase [Spirochaeta cellobiosiphila]|uniref:N-acetyltransferase n=1 Tax=Spirochaeta cellobiosiphila TaxID=504483 RepID=UPI0004192048|nr:N-acetyltransferase [Spirochaeta cellobiosiphila]